jgi:imidazolonepropionase-like amidohydrolase
MTLKTSIVGRWVASAGLVVGVLAGAGAAAVGQEGVVVFDRARLLTAREGAGFEVAEGRLVVSGGKILAVGPVAGEGAVAVPAGARVVDCAGKVIMPGLVDTHSHIGGVAGADGTGPIQPEVRALDSINVYDSGFRRAVAGGLTTLNVMPGSGHLLSGQTVFLKLRAGRGGAAGGVGAAGGERVVAGPVLVPGTVSPPGRIDEWFFLRADGRPMGSIKMANGTNPMREAPFPGTRGKAAALVREQWVKAVEYREKVLAAREGGKERKGPDRNLGMEALGEVLAGERIVQHHTHRADDVMTVLRIAQEFRYRVVLHHVSEAWKVAGEIAAADVGWGKVGIKGVPCSIILVDSPGGKLEAAELSYQTGAVLEKAGVTVAFHTDDWITDSRLFLRMAAMGVRAGMSREGAVRALTINGAKMLDLQERVGSLEVGKDADFVVLSGDPFSVYTKVEETWVEGVKVFDRENATDYLHAVGGFGAGANQSPYLCCFGGGIFVFGGKQWGAGGVGADAQGGGE